MSLLQIFLSERSCGWTRRMSSTFRYMSSSKADFQSSVPGLVVVIGGGAVGSLFAGRLGAVKRMQGRIWQVSAWQEHLGSVKKLPGIVVKEDGTVGNSCLIGDVRATSSVHEILESQASERGSSIRAVIIAVKQSGIRKAAQQAAELLGPGHGGLCIAVSNGLGHMELIADAISYRDASASVVHGVYHGGAYMPSAGVVVHSGIGKSYFGFLGETDPLSKNLLDSFSNLLVEAGLPSEVREDVLALAWEKLALNAALNAPAALLRVANGGLAASPACVELMRGVSKEAHAVACKVVEQGLGAERAAATSLVRDGWEACADRACAVAAATAGNVNSMLADVLRGRPTEVEAINGAVVRAGRAAGVPTPLNEALLLLVRGIAEAAPHGVSAGRVAGGGSAGAGGGAGGGDVAAGTAGTAAGGGSDGA